VFDAARLETELRDRGLATERLATAAADRMTYLARPDLGKVLSHESEKFLRSRAASWGRRDLVILVSDGLSASAAEGNAADTIGELVRILTASGWTHYPVLVVPFARVKLQDSVGALLGAVHGVILLGERPGLSAHDSLGAYLTFEPRAERTDADRNCVSNIREGGLPALAAAGKLAAMLVESRRMGLSGTALRDSSGGGGPGLQHVPGGIH
jgi:ethanolamine ammonia-lyase small subunit